MHYEGNFDVKRNIKEVYDFLTDPRKFTKVIPDLENLEVIDADNFKVRAKVGISFIKGSMDVKFKVVEKNEPRHAKIVGNGTGLQSSVNLTFSFDLEEINENSTLIKWFIDSQVGGLIASIGSRLIDSTAKKYLERIIEGIKRELSV
jgi:carbon monoxide dehydrogenase subunit G